jgi:Trypsin-like peptidase domain
MLPKHVGAHSTDEEKRDAIQQYLRFMVCICIYYSVPGKAERALSMASGFVISAKDRWYLVTAGHLLDGIEKAKAAGWTISQSGLVDCYAKDAQHVPAIPFNFEDAKSIHAFDEQLGIDAAVIYLSPLYCEMLKANNVEAISPGYWLHQQGVTFNHHFVVGFPATLLSLTAKSPEEIENLRRPPSAAAIPLIKRDKAPVGYETPVQRFVADISTNASIPDIGGMSGGPIFGVGTDKNGNDQLRLIAIQSAWLPNERIIFGCPIRPFMLFIEQQIQAFDDAHGIHA